MIEGVVVKSLKVLPDQRGFLAEILRRDEPLFTRFGQVYITAAHYGAAKAWHYHKRQTDYFVCVFGKALVGLYDGRKKSKTANQTQKVILEAPPSKKASLLMIPPGVVHGFTALVPGEARIVNIPSRLYRYQKPDEYRFPWNSQDIPFKWPPFVKSGG